MSGELENDVENDVENYVENSVLTAMDIILEHKKIIERDIWSLGYKLVERKELVKKINKYIQQECSHDFIIDYVDSMKDYQVSQKIVYCSKCEFVKPFN